MAVVNSVSAQGAQRIDQIRYPVVDNSEIMEIRGEIVEETSPREVEDKIYVAVGKDLKESQSILRWALHNSGGRQICILHVHQPAEKIPIMGTKFRINQLEAHQVKTFHDEERQTMHQLIDKYKQICREVGVSVEVQHIEMESIEKGIVELLLQHNVRRLVMGAAADNKYSKRMVDLKSKKAIYVRLHAAASCQIQFICKGKIIFTRQSRLDGLGASISSPSLLPDTNSDSEQSSLRSKSVGGAQNTRLRLNSLTPEYHRGMSDNRGIRRPVITLPNDNLESTPVSRLNAGRASDEWSVISQRSPSIGSRLSTCSSDLVDDSALIPYATIGSGEIRSDYSAVPGFLEDIHRPSPPSVLQEGGMNDELYDQLERAMAEAGNSRRDAFEESIRRRKAEKDAMEAKRRVKRSESLYANELRQRREIDEELEKTKEEHEDIKKELDEVAEELRMALEQKSFLESQVADFDQTIQELEQKMFSAVELLQNYKKERDELQVECDDALRSLEELREKQAEESSSSSTSRLYTEFSFSEIKDATCNFDPSLKIGEGGYGSIFRGFLRHTDVAIKMLNSHSLQGSSEFHQEVDVLSKLRHPNLVTLIGACPDAWIIVYEYLSGGSLEDRLNCKDNTPPLSWQNRIRIAAELCSVLIFLHSCDIVHGDLKPANLLLDKNLVSKLSDFGICRVLSQTEFSSNYTSLCCRTSPKGTFVYMDPEFISTGELTSKSDTYSFGIILLRLLTGKSPLGLTKEVQHALNKENLKNILDPTAGDWPFVQAQQLALLAMNCCDVVRENRPDLASEVWKVLEPMRVSCGLSSFRFGAEGRCQIPHYFNCPIFQEMMQDPVVAADGYTYEAEALRGWLDSGHNTSPMTNLELANSNLVPNRALKSAIQEWLQQS
ncbi:U-box domain-containing protein 33-like isoform X1 [Cynara cardunculus var. scolymus]|uniref:U-box domain-containing protein 33-like isoform X1 n=2 Tax=Cynara cardunculus var. scolymus TaxID=59895 RepID=UPI000D623ECA|nr:U-box domain-containing protein 33-like isoform X1 [Cynara cardunculus var. scolymus]